MMRHVLFCLMAGVVKSATLDPLQGRRRVSPGLLLWRPRCLQGGPQSICHRLNLLVHLEAKMYCQRVSIPLPPHQNMSMVLDQEETVQQLDICQCTTSKAFGRHVQTRPPQKMLEASTTLQPIPVSCRLMGEASRLNVVLRFGGVHREVSLFLCFMLCRYSSLLVFSGTKVDVFIILW